MANGIFQQPNIALGVQTPNVGRAISIFQEAQRRKAQAPLIAAQVQAQQVQTQQREQAILQARQEAKQESLMMGMLEVQPFLERGDFEGARKIMVARAERLQGQRVPNNDTLEGIAELDQDPEGFKQFINDSLGNFERQGLITPRQQKSKTGDFSFGEGRRVTQTVINPETGEPEQVPGILTTVRNKQTGAIEENFSPIGGAFVSTLGETGGALTERRVGEAGSRTAATTREQRAGELITRGVSAAESTATLRRGLTLLKTIETGGVNAISLAVKRSLGVEGADEGELSNSLAVAVLSQLRETFGAAFTENEGLRLERIQASFKKSPAANRRLLAQALKISERAARRGSAAAKKRGDTETVDDIKQLLEFSLDIDAPTPRQAAPQVGGQQAGGQRLVFDPATGQLVAQ